MMQLSSEYRPLVAPAVAALLAATLLAVTWHFATNWRAERSAEYRRANIELSQAASRYRNASDDQAVYEQYAARFLDMQERGWIGSEQRLDWIESLQRINADLRLPRLAYEIGERVPAEGLRNTEMNLRRTPMQLDLGLLHEGDLLTLLRRLDQEGAGLLSLRRCNLSRAQERVRLDADATNVRAECALDWFTLELERRRDVASNSGGAR